MTSKAYMISTSSGGAGHDERSETFTGGEPALVPRTSKAKENHLEVRDVSLILNT
jgi:hypothetical protein